MSDTVGTRGNDKRLVGNGAAMDNNTHPLLWTICVLQKSGNG